MSNLLTFLCSTKVDRPKHLIEEERGKSWRIATRFELLLFTIVTFSVWVIFWNNGKQTVKHEWNLTMKPGEFIKAYIVIDYNYIFLSCSLLQIMSDLTNKLPAYQFLTAFSLLISRICHANQTVFHKLEVSSSEKLAQYCSPLFSSASSVLFSIHLLRCWQGEFVKQTRASLAGDHFIYSCGANVGFRGDMVRRN